MAPGSASVDDVQSLFLAERAGLELLAAPPVTDDAAWTEALEYALASWIVASGRMIAKAVHTDSTWGTTTMRPRLLQWMDAFLAASAPGSALPVPVCHRRSPKGAHGRVPGSIRYLLSRAVPDRR